MNVEVHIERLILRGVPIAPSQRPALAAAVEAELTRLLRDQVPFRSFRSGIAVPQLRGSRIALTAGAEASSVGKQIAHAVNASFSSKADVKSTVSPVPPTGGKRP